MCTYKECSDPNRLYGSHQEWLDHGNQHTYVWHCYPHEAKFGVESDYLAHLEQEHPAARPELFLPEFVAEQVGPSLRPGRDCPLCPTAFATVPEMQKHLKHHLERLALFSFPSSDLDEGSDGSTGGSLRSGRVVRGRARKDSLAQDFDQSWTNSTISTTVDWDNPQPLHVIQESILSKDDSSGVYIEAWLSTFSGPTLEASNEQLIKPQYTVRQEIENYRPSSEDLHRYLEQLFADFTDIDIFVEVSNSIVR